MAGKYLYYDKYLKYKNKYLDLKGQIGGDDWTIDTIVPDTYTATKNEYTISVTYTTNGYNDTILNIKINSDDKQFDIEFIIDYSDKYGTNIRIMKNKGIQIVKSNDDLKKQLQSAITTILTTILTTKNKQSRKQTIIESLDGVL